MADADTQIHALRAANCDLAIANARLRAEVEALRAGGVRAPPRGPACFQELPVELLAKVFGYLHAPQDVFAAARTCRLARDASRTRGAFVLVDVAELDDHLQDARQAAEVAGGPVPYVSSAGAFLAFLAGCDAAAGVRWLQLRRHQRCDASAAGVAALVTRCTALEMLLIFSPRGVDRRIWSPADVEAILRAAAAAAIPVQHADVPLMEGSLDALAELPCLESLALSNHVDDYEFMGLKPEHLAPAQNVLPRLSKLRELFMLVSPNLDQFNVPRTFEVRSATLLSFSFNGNDLDFVAMDCPRLKSVSVRHWGRGFNYAAIALALIRGCPLLQWRAAAPGDDVAAPAPEQAMQAWNRQVANTIALARTPTGGAGQSPAAAHADRQRGRCSLHAWHRAAHHRGWQAGGAGRVS